MPVLYSETAAAPATPSTQARVQLTVVAPSGTPSLEFLRFTYSDDLGGSWTPVRFAERIPATPGQTIQVHDYEAPPNTERRYGVQSIRILDGEDIISARGTLDPQGSTVAVVLVLDSWWLKDPIDSTGNMRVQIYRRGDTIGERLRKERRENSQPIGSPYDSVVSDVIEAARMERTFTLYGDLQLDAFEELQSRRRTLLLQNMHGRGKRAQFYFQFGETLNFEELGVQGFETDPLYRVTVRLDGQPRP